jgi:hypothetical protein
LGIEKDARNKNNAPPHPISDIPRQYPPHNRRRAHNRQKVRRQRALPAICHRAVHPHIEERVERREHGEPPAGADEREAHVAEGAEGKELGERREGLGGAARLDGEGGDGEARENDEGEDAHGPACGAQFVVRFKLD